MNEKLHYLRSIIAERRTVKPQDYNGERIDDHFIRTLLEEANWAPTHGYTEPWRFTVFSDEALPKLGQFLADLDQPNPQAEDFNEQRHQRLRERPALASHIIGIGMHPGNNPKVPEIEEVCATAMAVQNMWLSAHALGLAAYWSTGSFAFRDETRAYFGLPEGDRSLGFFYLGKTDKTPRPGRRITPIEEKTIWRKE